MNHKNIFVSTLFLAIFLSCCVISGFRREIDENCALLGYYAARCGNFLPTLRDNLSVSSSTVKTLETGRIGCPETSARNYHYSLRNKPEEHSSILIKMLAACVHINRACLVENDLYIMNSKIQIQNSLFGCVVNRSQSNMKFESSGLHAFGWQVYSGIKINKEGPVHLSVTLWRNVVTWRKATSMASISNGLQ